LRNDQCGSLCAGKYIVTHEKVNPSGSAHKNLNVWKADSGELVAAFHKKGVTDDGWPALQFDAAETHLFFLVKDAIVVYDMAGDFTKALRKVPMEGVSQFSICLSEQKVAATFVPETKGRPAIIAVNEWTEGGSITNRKQFFRVRKGFRA
jgi:uncharacterized protein with WD repeat